MKSIIHLANRLYDCIDLSDYPEGMSLNRVIRVELALKDGEPLTMSKVEQWLRGLPPACTIPYCNKEIEGALVAIGCEEWSIDDYWRWCASRVLTFAETGGK